MILRLLSVQLHYPTNLNGTLYDTFLLFNYLHAHILKKKSLISLNIYVFNPFVIKNSCFSDDFGSEYYLI